MSIQRGILVGIYEQRRRLATFAAAALAFALGYHVVFGHNGLTVYEQKRQETQGLSQQLDDLTKENERLQGHVERLKTDPDAIERQAREELHYTRPGEVIVTLPPDQLSENAKNRGAVKR
jgi:cell division protein FtsB